MLVNFTKMHSLGNDFIIIDSLTQQVKLQSNQIKRLADRRLGIGCDQIILIAPPKQSTDDFYYHIFNANGQEVEQCGNGARCAAQYLYDSGLITKSTISAQSLGGQAVFSIKTTNEVSITIDYPTLSSIGNYNTQLSDKAIAQIYTINLGNPHGICLVTDIKHIPIKKWGQQLNQLDCFPDGANIGFMHILDSQHIALRVFERGVGPTLACGSNACASVLIGQHIKKLEQSVKVSFIYGALYISADNQKEKITMTGPVRSIFTGHFRL